ncbi:VOC family protein [Kitasatospora sp. GP82]|uniref:VOC family protein n=1 Tax=Kitasatospora sp. GP82 TaxID=3035089 RepID=UPI002475DADA|nr:VOC family protein [Kitasatospora sp. GP82]MDH6128967.1 putative enzyme related to lactoylglutathione lyase [Kitasatospora sp. GP82]
MPEVTEAYAPGTPCWVDLMAKDQQAALDFYRDLFGWQGQIGPPEFGGYTVCTLNGKPVAGVMTAMAPEGQPTPPTVWTTYISTSDADAAQQAITANGGTVMYPVMDVGTVGRMLVAADPTGAVFGVWQPVDFFGAHVVNEPGALTWNELHTGDVDAATAFYGSALGIDAGPMEGAEDYYALKVGGKPVGGMTRLSNDPPGTPAHWLTYFSVDDADSVVDALVKRGGTVLVPPFDMVAGRMAVLADPQGAVFAVIKAKPM